MRVCTLPLDFAYCSVTGSLFELYHNLVNSIRISSLCNQLVAESKQGIEDIPSFLCCEVKVMLPLSHTKIALALTVSVTANRRAFIPMLTMLINAKKDNAC